MAAILQAAFHDPEMLVALLDAYQPAFPDGKPQQHERPPPGPLPVPPAQQGTSRPRPANTQPASAPAPPQLETTGLLPACTGLPPGPLGPAFWSASTWTGSS